MQVKSEPLLEGDHRRLGRELDLFSVSERVGPGLILWHPKGAMVRSLLEDYWRKAHLGHGYQLVYSPHLGRSGLWETSGHLDFYRDSMFAPMELDGQSYYVKPMNCPFHMQIFDARRRSYRELPLRYAELGTVYRYERSGVLDGLLRVRGFTQDDAHIFCASDQLEEEIVSVLDFVREFLGVFSFRDFSIQLSTRPEKSVGEDSAWEFATEVLRRALERLEIDYRLDAGGGAFYGPKLDAQVEDAQGRAWQISTVQFDFNLPERFGLSYVGSDGNGHRPYVIHRALLGSLERFFGILLEHYEGAFPPWLAPLQARLLPVTERQASYAEKVERQLKERELRVDKDARNEPLSARVRDAEMEKVPFLLVVGDREVGEGTVSLRESGSRASRSLSLAELCDRLEGCAFPQ